MFNQPKYDDFPYCYTALVELTPLYIDRVHEMVTSRIFSGKTNLITTVYFLASQYLN